MKRKSWQQSRNEEFKLLMHQFYGWPQKLKNILENKDVIQAVVLIVLVIGAFAIKFESPTWKWIYLLSSGATASLWILLQIYCLILKMIRKYWI